MCPGEPVRYTLQEMVNICPPASYYGPFFSLSLIPKFPAGEGVDYIKKEEAIGTWGVTGRRERREHTLRPNFRLFAMLFTPYGDGSRVWE